MLGRKERSQLELFISGSLRQLIPNDHMLVRVERVLDLLWLRDEVADCYCLEDGRPGIDPEAATVVSRTARRACVGCARGFWVARKASKTLRARDRADIVR